MDLFQSNAPPKGIAWKTFFSRHKHTCEMMIVAGFRTVFERCHLYPKSKTRGGTCPKGGDVFPFLAEDIPIPIPVANIPRVVV